MDTKAIAGKLQFMAVLMAAGYGAYAMPATEQPYSFLACFFGVVYGIFGMLAVQNTAATTLMNTMMSTVPMALINIQVYATYQNPYAMAHGIFVLPLSLEMAVQFFGYSEYETATQWLKNANVTGNFVSICTLSYLEDNYMLGLVGISFVLTQVSRELQSDSSALSEFFLQAGYCAMFACATLAISEEFGDEENSNNAAAIRKISRDATAERQSLLQSIKLFVNY